MSIVVSDTSPIRALANLGLLALLGDLYVEVIVSPAVRDELGSPPEGQTVVDLASLPFVHVQMVSDGTIIGRLLEQLDRGESEALALALELRVDLILIDESKGRAEAKRMGLETIGVLGVLLEARHRGLVVTLSPLLDELEHEHRFFISAGLRAEILRLAGE